MGPARTGLLILGVFVACSSAQQPFNFGNELQFGRAPRVCRELYELGLAGVHPYSSGRLDWRPQAAAQRSGVVERVDLARQPRRYGGRWGVLRTGAWVIHGGRRLWIPLPMYGFGHTVGLSTGVRIDRRVTSGLKTGIPQGRVGPVGRFEHMGPNFGPGLEGNWGFPGMGGPGGRPGRMGQTGPWGPVQGGPGGDEMFFSWEQNLRGGGPWGGMNQGSRGLGGSGGLGLDEGMGSELGNMRQGSSGIGGRGTGTSGGSELDLGIGASSRGQPSGTTGGASSAGGQGGPSGTTQGNTNEGSGFEPSFRNEWARRLIGPTRER
ncbi:hypothetical protein MTO96_025539 [Rhipicephalus appendiculatus]